MAFVMQATLAPMHPAALTGECRRERARAELFAVCLFAERRLARRLAAAVWTPRPRGAPALGVMEVSRAQAMRTLRRERLERALGASPEQCAREVLALLHPGRAPSVDVRRSLPLLHALMRQPVAFRDALVLSQLLGLSKAEIADALALPWPRALALVTEGLVRWRGALHADPSAAEASMAFDARLAGLRRLVEDYLQRAAQPRAARRTWLWWLQMQGLVRPLRALLLSLLWFMVPVALAFAVSQWLLFYELQNTSEHWPPMA